MVGGGGATAIESDGLIHGAITIFD